MAVINSRQFRDWPVSPSTLAAASRALSCFGGAFGSGELSSVAVVVSWAGRGVSILDDSVFASAATSIASAARGRSAGVSAASVKTRAAGADVSFGGFSVLATLRLRTLWVLGGVAWVVFFLEAMRYLLRLPVRNRDAAPVAPSQQHRTVTSERSDDQANSDTIRRFFSDVAGPV